MTQTRTRGPGLQPKGTVRAVIEALAAAGIPIATIEVRAGSTLFEVGEVRRATGTDEDEDGIDADAAIEAMRRA